MMEPSDLNLQLLRSVPKDSTSQLLGLIPTHVRYLKYVSLKGFALPVALILERLNSLGLSDLASLLGGAVARHKRLVDFGIVLQIPKCALGRLELPTRNNALTGDRHGHCI